jgi:hypothetical protein
MDITVIDLHPNLFTLIVSIPYLKTAPGLVLLKALVLIKIMAAHPLPNILSVRIILQLIAFHVEHGHENRYLCIASFQRVIIDSVRSFFVFLTNLLNLFFLRLVIARVLIEFVQEITETTNRETPQTNYRPLFIIHTIYNHSLISSSSH